MESLIALLEGTFTEIDPQKHQQIEASLEVFGTQSSATR